MYLLARKMQYLYNLNIPCIEWKVILLDISK